jgi:signal transduction histidine kinase
MMNKPDYFARFSRLWRKYSMLALISALATVIIGLSVFYFSFSFNKPIMGLTLDLNDSGWLVKSIDPNGVAHRSQIESGDTPITINGQPAESFLAPYTQQGYVIGALIKDIFVAGADGQIKHATTSTRPTFQAKMELAVLILTALIFWVVGLFVFFKQPQKKAARLLCLDSLCFGLILSSNVAGERLLPGSMELSVTAALIGPWLLLHFFLILPEDRVTLQKSRRLYLIYLIPLATIIMFLTIGIADGQPLPWYYNVRMIEIALVLLAAIVTAILNYTVAASPRTKQQMKIIATSSLMALMPFILFFIIPDLLLQHKFLPTGYLMFFIGFIPLGMGYAVVTHRLLDIDIIIRRSMIYGLISVAMALVLAAGIVPVMSKGQGNLGLEIITAMVLGIIGTILFGPLKNAFEKIVDRFFYRDRYDYRRIIQRLNLSLNNYQEISDISRLIVGTCLRTLNLAGASLIIQGQSKLFDVNASEGSFSDSEKQSKLLALVYKRNPRYEFPSPAAPDNPDLAFFIPLISYDKEIGFLCISPKITRQDFSSDDIYLLQGLSSVAATALQSAMLIRAVSLRDTFVSIASHELRTPLTSIIGYTDLLMRKDMPPETRQIWLKNILDNGQKIADMVDDLLNVTRIQSGKINLKMNQIDLSEVITERLPLYQESTNIHTFSIDLPPDLPKITVDRDKTWQIIGNLLSNAIKYSPRGGNITISARHDSPNNRVVFSVKDEGLGISPQDEATLFKTFHRVQRPETRGIRGSGLGLYIVKEWAEAMGGDVWLRSQLNQGSTFFVSFPTDRPIS